MEDGTGIVHIAPAYGELDYEAGQANGLDFVHMVDLQGKVIGNYRFSGKFVKEADEDIIAVAGTRSGADTAIVVRPVNSQDLFELKVKEILCKPRDW